MCGIVGCVSKSKLNLDIMLDAIVHRGPDGFGKVEYSSKADFNVYLGHRRLSIIDVTDNSSQPFYSDNFRYVIVFNGEIYNYLELKKDYLQGFNFKSNGDTEVILELFCKYGSDSFKLLKGMFAFAIFDIIEDELYLCRDGLGIKPLYYYIKNDNLFFASEISALKTQNLDFSICENAITEFFLNGFLYEPDTGFRYVKKVFPGNYVKISLKNKLVIEDFIFWRPIVSKDTRSYSVNNIMGLVKKEYKSHLISDVPLGLFYSGGIDSSTLLTLGNEEVVPYFIDSKKGNVESTDKAYAKKIAKLLERSFITIDMQDGCKTKEELISKIKEIAFESEELLMDYTFSVSKAISQEARNRGYKVMMSGMGGDELFLGYPRHRLVRFEKFYFVVFFTLKRILQRNKSFSKKFYRFKTFFENKDFVLRYTNLLGYFQEVELKDLLVRYDPLYLVNFRNKLNTLLDNYLSFIKVKQAQILDLYGCLSHNFSVADKSSMRASVEIRVPLATTELFDSSLRTPVKQLLNYKYGKLPLLNILKKSLDIKLFKRPKEGFNPDLEELIETIGLDTIFEILVNEKNLSFIRKDFIQNIINEHKSGKVNHSYRIYQLLYFNFWIDCNYK